jgi:hypothetical protein
MATFTRRCVVDWGATGVAASLYVTVYNGSNTAVVARALVTGEHPTGSGIYYADITWDTSWTSPRVVWDDGTDYAVEDVPTTNIVKVNGSEVTPRTLLPASAVSITSPVDVNDGDRLNLVQGDDHTSGSRLPTWSIEEYEGPSLSGATCVLRLLDIADYRKRGSNAEAVLEVSATVSQASTTVTATASITSAQSALLNSYPPGDETTHRYQLLATTSGGALVTLKLGDVTVARRID